MNAVLYSVALLLPPLAGAAPDDQSGFSEKQQQQVEKAASEFFTAPEPKRATWKFDESLDRLVAGHEDKVRRAVWKAYQAASIHGQLKEDFEKNQARYQTHRSAYTLKRIGKRPEPGWPLFIALHGGGGGPKELNDQQWQIMQSYYRDQTSVTGYQYLALRAPNDAWNGFYDGYILPLIGNLIRQFILFGDVDPDKVFLMGYSHGGYGAFYIGPKMPDRFAAIHCSAAAPTDGTISPKSLRNTRFTYMIGELDTAYGRRRRCEEFNEAIRKLKESDKDDFPVVMELKKSYGHGNLPDRGKIKELYPFTRNPVPRHLSWELKDSIVTHFFWLNVPEPANGQELDAKIEGSTIRIVTRNIKEFELNLDGRLVAVDKPVRLILDGKSREVPLVPRFSTLCRSLLESGDPRLTWTCRIHLKPGNYY